MFKLSLTSVRYRALTEGIRGFHRTQNKPLRTMQEDARSEAFWARMNSGEDWLARLFFFPAPPRGSTPSQRSLRFLSLPRWQEIADALLDVAEDSNP